MTSEYRISRRDTALAASGLLLEAMWPNPSQAITLDPADMTFGDRRARITLIEYASLTCSHCQHFHDEVWPPLKANYIDRGLVLFILREFPTAPVPVSTAEFQLARCNAPNGAAYFGRIDILFERRQAVLDAAGAGANPVRNLLIEIGRSFHLSERQARSCIADEASIDRMRRVVEEAQRIYSVTGTPSLILNERKLTDPNAVTYDGLSRAIEAALQGA